MSVNCLSTLKPSNNILVFLKINTCVHVSDNLISSLLGLLHKVHKYVSQNSIFRQGHQNLLCECCSVHSNIRSTCPEFLLTHKAVAYEFGSNNAEHIACSRFFLEHRTGHMCFFCVGKAECMRREEQYQVDILYLTQHYSRHETAFISFFA